MEAVDNVSSDSDSVPPSTILPIPAPRKLVALRPSRNRPPIDRTYSEVLHSIELRFRHLYELADQPHTLGHEIIVLLRDLLWQETNARGFEKSIAPFFHKLWESGSMREFFRELLNEAQRLRRKEPYAQNRNTLRLLSELEVFLEWYRVRIHSLLELSTQDFESQPNDRFFGFRVLGDHSWCNLEGFLVQTGLRLVGKKGDDLFLKLRIFEDGREVNASNQGVLWTDRKSAQVQDNRFVAWQPICPTAERQIIDVVELFVPYAALALKPGRSEIELQLDLCNAHGLSLLSHSELFPLHNSHQVTNELIPAPQNFTLWETDPVTGDAIHSIQVTQGFRDLAGRCEEIVEVTIAADVCGHRDQRIIIECRVLFPDGSLVGRSVPEGQQQFPFTKTIELFPQGAVTRCEAIKIVFPLSELALERGKHELLFEVAMLGVDKRTLCGAVRAHALQIEDIISPLKLEPFSPLPVTDPFSGICFKSLEVTFVSDWMTAVRQALRAEVRFSAHDWNQRVVRVLCALEAEVEHLNVSGWVPLVQTETNRVLREGVCIGGYQGSFDRSAIIYFSAPDILAAVQTISEESSNPVKLRLRCKVFSIEDKIIFEISKDINLKDSGFERTELQIQKNGMHVLPMAMLSIPALRIEEVKPKSVIRTSVLPTEVVLSVNLSEVELAKGTLYAEILDGEGKAVEIEDHGKLSGTILAFDFSAQLEHALYRAGRFQISAFLELDVSRLVTTGRFSVREAKDGSAYSFVSGPEAFYLKVMLFGADGRLIQIFNKPLHLTSGVFFESTGPEIHVPQTSPPSQPSFFRRLLRR